MASLPPDTAVARTNDSQMNRHPDENLWTQARWRLQPQLPKVSVVVPTYNRSRFLESTLGSIFRQTVPVHEVLLVDDGSTDNTASTIRALLVEHPDWKGRLRYFQQDNQGKSVATNAGLQVATGDWIAFNDSDDRWLPEKLELQFKALGQHEEAGACFTDVCFVNNPKLQETAFDLSSLKYSTTFGIEDHVPYLFSADAGSGIYMQSVLVSTAVMREFGKFDASIRMSMDTDFIFRLGLTTPMCFVNLPLVEVDRTEARLIGLTTEYPMGCVERLHVHEQLLTKWLSLTRESHPDLRRGLLDRRSSIQSALANQYLFRGEFETARSVMSRAMRQNRRTRYVVKFLLTAIAPGLLEKEIRRREDRR